jgi:selenide,water dikinase
MIEASCAVIGGHSIRDDEIKFGYAVTGVIHPERVLTNSGAKPGDKLLFSKAIGTGVISTAIKKQKAEQSWIDAAVRSMTTLNKTAAEVICGVAPGLRPGEDGAHDASETRRYTGASDARFAVHAMTDVTGFGLIGHAREMALGSDVSLRIMAPVVPLLEGAVECVRAGFVPGGLNANREFAEGCVAYAGEVGAEIRTLLYDPQTAGGLLISVAAEDAGRLSRALNEAGVPAVEVGEVVPRTSPLIAVFT